MSTTHDVIVVGGGPGGAACAAKLVEAGRRVLVLDRETFPRTKLCAGWITPQAVEAVGLDPATYPYRFSTFEKIMAHAKGLSYGLATPQHSIRRFEFDRWLLDSAGAEVVQHTVRAVARGDDGVYEVDGQWRAPWLVGAGGTRCPVYRELFRDANPRAEILQAATLEHEFAYEWKDPHCHLWFFDDGLPGYAWYVPKANGYLNCGIGGMAQRLKAKGESIKTHWQRFAELLTREGFVDNLERFEPKGYSYYLRGKVDTVQVDNAFIVGDAAGLATRDLCEGIGPAIESGFRAAASITDGADYSLDDISPFSSEYAPVRWLLEYMFVKRPLKKAA